MKSDPIHNLVPALDFLSQHLGKDIGREVVVGCRPGKSRFVEYDYWLRFSGDERVVSFDASCWRWPKSGTQPNELPWETYKLSISPAILWRPPNMVRRVRLQFIGLEQVTGLLPTDECPIADLVGYFNRGYLSDDSPVLHEYKRRFSIEAAEEQLRLCNARLKRLLAEGPYIGDLTSP